MSMNTPIPVSRRANLRRLSEEFAIVVQEAFHGESELKAPASVSLEAEAATAAAAGLEADLVLIHPSGTSGTLAAGLDELIQSLKRIGLQPVAAKGEMPLVSFLPLSSSLPAAATCTL